MLIIITKSAKPPPSTPPRWNQIQEREEWSQREKEKGEGEEEEGGGFKAFPRSSSLIFSIFFVFSWCLR